MESINGRRGKPINRLWRFLLLLGMCLGIGACASSEKPYVVEMIRTNSFAPATLSVPRGATVVWKNRDYEVHSTVAEPALALDAEGASQESPGWESGDILSGGTFTIRFDAPGVYVYACSYHAGMVGMILVDEASSLARQESE